jgi:hypothetical protein
MVLFFFKKARATRQSFYNGNLILKLNLNSFLGPELDLSILIRLIASFTFHCPKSLFVAGQHRPAIGVKPACGSLSLPKFSFILKTAPYRAEG